MFEGITGFFKRIIKTDQSLEESSKDTAKERLHLVLMQDRANVSADFLELMKQEIIEVIKKYIEVDEKAIDVRLTNQPNEDGTNGSPALYANIPIINIKNESRINRENRIDNDYDDRDTNYDYDDNRYQSDEEVDDNYSNDNYNNDENDYNNDNYTDDRYENSNEDTNEEQAEVVVRFADDEEDEDDKKDDK